ncbi:MAG: ribosomal L7Ae/L30e/S12e/Gadd45 family protein [Gemmatimonadetes bacterium]|nr:ribosomal L7Ae/L30e/S12e/Gadd45 family protein [Gemmatimonadota bacterium]
MLQSQRSSAHGLLGLARRAGAVALGTAAVRRAVREGEALLILMAGDASSVQMDKIRTTLRDRPIPQVILGDRNTLGAAVGLAAVSAVAVTNRSLADRLLVELNGSQGKRGTDAVEA